MRCGREGPEVKIIINNRSSPSHLAAPPHPHPEQSREFQSGDVSEVFVKRWEVTGGFSLWRKLWNNFLRTGLDRPCGSVLFLGRQMWKK